MRINIQVPNANWILDEQRNDYKKYTRHKVVGLSDKPDLVWFINLFGFPRYANKLKCKSVIQVHHIDENKIKEYNFKAFNKADMCISLNDISVDQAKKHLDIPVRKLPCWLISSRRNEVDTSELNAFKSRFNIPTQIPIIGSFVKDGEGKKGDKPKLSKGPDIFLDIIDQIRKDREIFVLLGGFAREYVRNSLKKMGVNFSYAHRYANVNTLYDISDWCFVTSRFEGGPQSILEASYRKVNLLSRDVGVAKEVLHPNSICNNVDDFVSKFKNGIDTAQYNYDNICEKHSPEIVIPKYDDFFDSLLQ